MGNPQNRARKLARISPSKKAKKFKHGDKEAVPEPGPSGAKIGAQNEDFGISSESIDTVRKGNIFTNEFLK